MLEPTIKERLFSDIRDHANPPWAWSSTTPDELAKRHGLSGHDLVKNLEQLRKEGQIKVKWGPGDRIERVRINRGALNLSLLDNSDKPLKGNSQVRLADAISRLPWEGEWRKWDHTLLKQVSGLDSFQIASTMKVLREAGRLVQLGGGHRGVPIKGVRWRGEAAPSTEEAPAPVESVAEPVVEAPEASGEVGYAQLRLALKRWSQLKWAKELLEATGKTDMSDALALDPEYRTMSTIGPELERLLKTVE